MNFLSFFIFHTGDLWISEFLKQTDEKNSLAFDNLAFRSGDEDDSDEGSSSDDDDDDDDDEGDDGDDEYKTQRP